MKFTFWFLTSTFWSKCCMLLWYVSCHVFVSCFHSVDIIELKLPSLSRVDESTLENLLGNKQSISVMPGVALTEHVCQFFLFFVSFAYFSRFFGKNATKCSCIGDFVQASGLVEVFQAFVLVFFRALKCSFDPSIS